MLEHVTLQGLRNGMPSSFQDVMMIYSMPCGQANTTTLPLGLYYASMLVQG